MQCVKYGTKDYCILNSMYCRELLDHRADNNTHTVALSDLSYHIWLQDWKLRCWLNRKGKVTFQSGQWFI